MNELRLTGLLKDRYNTNFGGLQLKFNKPGLSKPCSYWNNLSAHPSNSETAPTMTRPLRLKIHDALNGNVFMDAEGLGIFIGGRRRNRKKKNKKNGQNKKKSKKTESKSRNIHSESSSSCSDSCSSGRTSPKSEDKLPLLSYCLDGEDTLDLSDPYSCFCTEGKPEEENSDQEEEIYTATMSFLFKKKAKEVKKEKEVVNELQTRVEEVKIEAKETTEEVKQEVQEELKEAKVALEESVEKAVDGGTPAEQEKPKEPAPEPEPVAEAKPAVAEEKSEKSPLVNGKDMGPASGLCCTIL